MMILLILLSAVAFFLSGVFWASFRTSRFYFKQLNLWDLIFSIGLALAGFYNIIALVGQTGV
jgi:hypothetical protein